MALTPEEMLAVEDMVRRVVGDMMESGVDQWCTVQAVNTDGTVNVRVKGSVAPAQAVSSWTDRQVGQLVLVRRQQGRYTAFGPAGQPVAEPTQLEITRSNDAAPGGAGWEQIAAVWAKDGALWLQRTVAAPPPSGGTVTRTANRLVTYRGGGQSQEGKAEQGDYTGRGLQLGLATFGAGAWDALSGHTATGGTLTVHRISRGGFTYGPVPMTWYGVSAVDPPGGTPTLQGDASVLTAVSVNQTLTVPLTAAFAQKFASGAASAVACWSTSARENAEVDSVVVSITY